MSCRCTLEIFGRELGGGYRLAPGMTIYYLKKLSSFQIRSEFINPRAGVIANSIKLTIAILCNLYKILLVVIELGFNALLQDFCHRIPTIHILCLTLLGVEIRSFSLLYRCCSVTAYWAVDCRPVFQIDPPPSGPTTSRFCSGYTKPRIDADQLHTNRSSPPVPYIVAFFC